MSPSPCVTPVWLLIRLPSVVGCFRCFTVLPTSDPGIHRPLLIEPVWKYVVFRFHLVSSWMKSLPLDPQTSLEYYFWYISGYMYYWKDFSFGLSRKTSLKTKQNQKWAKLKFSADSLPNFLSALCSFKVVVSLEQCLFSWQIQFEVEIKKDSVQIL